MATPHTSVLLDQWEKKQERREKLQIPFHNCFLSFRLGPTT
jgi:hypothetical protein